MSSHVTASGSGTSGSDGHDHHHDHGHHGLGHSHGAGAPRRALAVALGLTAGFMFVEAAVGLWSGSLALMADAGHMLNDSAALGLALFISRIAERPRTRRLTFGYRRAEVLGAMANGAALLAAGGWVLVESIGRLFDPPEVHAEGLIAAASLGLVVNLVSAVVLARSGGESINVRAALLHVLGDALGSVAAIAAGIFLYAFGWRLADPIASLAIASLIIVGALRLLRDVTHLLMEGSPEGQNPQEVEDTIRATPGVAQVHDLHLWSLVPGTPMLSVHVVLSPGAHGTDIVRMVGARLLQVHGIEHTTVQPEAPSPPLVTIGTRRPRPPSSSAEEPNE